MNPLDQIFTAIASFRAQLAENADRFVAANTVAEVERAKAEGKLAVAFDLEGGIPLCGRPEMVQLFRDLGVRQIHLAYNRNNAIGGGCYDEDVPLTALGRAIVRAIHEAGMFMDIMAMGAGPVIFSHANPRALAADGRNLRPEQIDACVATGGVICVNGVGRFLDDPQAGTPAILRAIDHLVQRIGPEHVGLGIDYEYHQGIDDFPPGEDRARWWPPEQGYGPEGANVRIAAPEQIPEITAGMLDLGYPEAAIRRILGLNMLELAERVWQPNTCSGHRGEDGGSRW